MKTILCKDAHPSIYFETLKKENKLDMYPELKNIINIPQSPIHHPEGDVWNHTMLVLEQAAKLRQYANNPYGFMLTALFHDLGKAVTTTIEEDGRIRSIGHENCISIVQSALDRLDVDETTMKYVCNMVKYHMRPNALVAQNSSQKAFNRLFSLSIDPHDLILFAKADYLGRKDLRNFDENEKILKDRLKSFNDLK